MSESLGILVQALSNLQDSSGSTNLSLPRIITVGNQSAGKSSIIEAFVGKPFLPRGSDIVTRCPLHVRLHQTRSGTQEYAVFKKDRFHDSDKKFTDFNEVCSEIERKTDQRTNNSKNKWQGLLLICLLIFTLNKKSS